MKLFYFFKQCMQILLEKIKLFFQTMDQVHREKVVELTQYEVRELENIFMLLLLSSFTGIPSPSTSIAVELLSVLEHEIKILNSRARDADDALAELAGYFEIG